MIDLKKKYGYDKELAEQGARLVIGADKDKDWLLVRRMPNDDYIKELTETMQNYGEKIDELKESDPKAGAKLDVQLQCKVLAKTVLVGWGEGVQNDGKPVTYSVDAAAVLLEELDDLRVAVAMFARDNKNFPPKINIEHVKKS